MYSLDITINETDVAFTDDVCGTLRLFDSIGESQFLYIYIGADNDVAPVDADCGTVGCHNDDDRGEKGYAYWGELSVTYSSAPAIYPTAGPTPVPQPTVGGVVISDNFTSFNPRIWQAQCAGCFYDDGYLEVDGKFLQRTLNPLPDLYHITAMLTRDEVFH